MNENRKDGEEKENKFKCYCAYNWGTISPLTVQFNRFNSEGEQSECSSGSCRSCKCGSTGEGDTECDGAWLSCVVNLNIGDTWFESDDLIDLCFIFDSEVRCACEDDSSNAFCGINTHNTLASLCHWPCFVLVPLILFLGRDEWGAINFIRKTFIQTKGVSTFPSRQTITINVVPFIFQANILMLAERVWNKEACIKVLVATVKTLGWLAIDGNCAHGSHDELFHLQFLIIILTIII